MEHRNSSLSIVSTKIIQFKYKLNAILEELLGLRTYEGWKHSDSTTYNTVAAMEMQNTIDNES